MKNLKTFYDELFKKEGKIFDDLGSPFLERILSSVDLKPCKALDIGSGEGAASVYLAKMGFDVTAIDLSDNAFKRIRENSELGIKTVSADITKLELEENYGVVMSFFMFHHLKRTDVLELLKKLDRGTLPGGIHIFKFITYDSDFYRLRPDADFFFSDGKEMEELYKEWSVVFNEIHESRAATSDAVNSVLSFAAIKKS